MTVTQVEFMVDLSAVDELLAVGFALESVGRNSRYMRDLVTAAVRSQEDDFNTEIEAFASASGRLGHMFEWGTQGINTSPSNMSFSPTDPRARLWKMEVSPNRSGASINYTFQPSVAVVPKPPAGKTGIPQAKIDRLQDHIFWNKAMVMETGMKVNIEPKESNESGQLFVPNIWRGAKGFTMYKRGTQPDISSGTQGTFTAMFTDYWEHRAQPGIEDQIVKWFDQDIMAAIKDIHADKKLTKPYMDNRGKIKLKVRAVRRRLERAAAARAAASRAEGERNSR